MSKLKPRQQDILMALRGLGGTATTREIAESVQLHANGVSQSLDALSANKLVRIVGGHRGDTTWEITITGRLRLIALPR